MKSSFHSFRNTIHSSKSRTANLIVLLLIIAAIPFTLMILNQNQDTRQHAQTSPMAPGTGQAPPIPERPGTDTITPLQSPTGLPGSTMMFTITGHKSASIWVYIHASSLPSATPGAEPVSNTYDPNNVQPKTLYRFAIINGNSGEAKLTLPQAEGTYHIVTIAHSKATTTEGDPTEFVCYWTEELMVYDKASPGGLKQIAGCKNAGGYGITVSKTAPPGYPGGATANPLPPSSSSCQIDPSKCTACSNDSQICIGTDTVTKQACSLEQSCGNPQAGTQSCDCGTDKGFTQVACGSGSYCIGVSGANPSCHYCAKPAAGGAPGAPPGSVTLPCSGAIPSLPAGIPPISIPQNIPCDGRVVTIELPDPTPFYVESPYAPDSAIIIIPILVLLFLLFL